MNKDKQHKSFLNPSPYASGFISIASPDSLHGITHHLSAPKKGMKKKKIN